MAGSAEQTQLRNAGILLGLGLGGFFDGIVLHQLLQWHHMVSNVESFSPETVAGLRVNTLADGLFHAVTYILTVAGVALLWRALRGGERGTARQFIGLALLGWGLFNLVEGIVDHCFSESTMSTRPLRESNGSGGISPSCSGARR